MVLTGCSWKWEKLLDPAKWQSEVWGCFVPGVLPAFLEYPLLPPLTQGGQNAGAGAQRTAF